MDGGAATYAYDGGGQRMKKTVGSETTYYFYGVGGLLCEFTTTNTGATTAASTDKTLYHTTDKLGSAVLVVNASGTVVENNRTLPYGEAWLAETASTNDKKFTSYLRDNESGLDYAMRRYYANTSGRFTSPDKGGAALFDPQTMNRYTYVANDPVNRLDADGNEIQCPHDPQTGTYTCLPEPIPPQGPGDDPLWDLVFNSPMGGSTYQRQWTQADFFVNGTNPMEEARRAWKSPVDNCVVSRYMSETHGGTDITTQVGRGEGLTGYGTGIRSISNGVVSKIGRTNSEGINYVTVFDQDAAMYLTYMHISGGDIHAGMSVTSDTILGMTDQSGAAAAAAKGVQFGPHVHIYGTDRLYEGLPFGGDLVHHDVVKAYLPDCKPGS